MLQKILVPLDGSGLAEKALPYAQAIAQKFEAKEIILVWVLQPPTVVTMDYGGITVPAIDSMMEHAEQEAEAYLRRLQSQFQQQNIPTRFVVLKSYSVPEAIIELARQEKVDVIVKTTHGRSGLSRWLFGNVALKVLQGAPCPVFLVRVSSKEQPDAQPVTN